MRRALSSGLFLCALAAQSMHAQLEMGQQQQSIGANQSVMVAILQPVTGEPYQAEKITHSKQTLSDGTIITHETKGLIARDTEGRMREDLYIVHSGQVQGHEQDMNLQSATVGDPIAHTMLLWTGEKTKIAMQMQLPSLPKGPAAGSLQTILAAPPPPPPPGHFPPTPGVGSAPVPTAGLGRVPGGNLGGNAADNVHTEELGQTSIEGVLVTGKRITTTIPLGKIGNDRPIVVVHEEWRSPELKILVKTIDTDPRTGEQTMELEGLTRTDPDATLFQAPSGYKVQDMADMLKGLGNIGRPNPAQ
jgi:hypothetical protein